MKDLIKITGSNKKPLPDISTSTPPGPTADTPLNTLVNEEPVDLINLLVDDTGEKRQSFPDSAIKNRAAYASLLSQSPNISQTYQSIVSENKAGEDYTRNAIMSQVGPRAESDMKTSAFSMLADPSIPDDQKRKIIASLNDGFAKEPATIVANAAFQAPSKGETPEAEEVRLSSADAFRGSQDYKGYVQGLINRHEAMRSQDGQAAFIPEFLEILVPFSINVNAARNLTKLAEELRLNAGKGRAFALPGNIAMDISEALKAMPADKRTEVAGKLYQIIENNQGIIFTGDNKFNEVEQIKKLLTGDYSKWDQFFDNAAGVLDTVGLGLPSLLKGGVKKLTSLVARTPEKVEQKVVQRGIVNTTSPAAPMSVLKESNPEKARAAYAAIAKSEGDEVAQALSGTTRSDALAAESLPQPAVVDGTVEAKLVSPDAELAAIEPNPEVKKAVDSNGGYQYTERERKAAEAHILNDMNNITGLNTLDNMVSVALDGDKTIIKGMFGSTDGGFKNSEEAFNQAKFALKEYGITDKDITLYKRIDGEYVPISREEAKAVPGDYTVGINLDYKLADKDVGAFDNLDVKWNWLDRVTALRSQKAGTAANHLMTNASMLHPTITGSASVAVDKAVKIDKLFLEMHSEFSDGFIKLAKDRQQKLYDHLKEANQFGLELSDVDLLGRGFANHEIDLVKKWRKNWDTHFYFENADVVRSLDNQGFHVFEDAAKGSKFFVKPVGKNANLKVYDPSFDQVRLPSRLEMDQLYERGGTYAQFRRPVKINGVEVEHMMVRNNPTEYLRKMSPHDQVLNYRKGYFQVGYKAPLFIEEIVKTSGGTEKYRKAVALAGSTEEAEHIANRLATSSGRTRADFNVRNDVRDFRPETDYYWDIQHASGRVAQRHRGKLLEDATSSATGFDGKYILDPVESAVRASRSLSSRIAMRDVIETHKARAVQQYGDVFPKVEGQTKWVDNANSLVSEGKMDSKHISDARTTVEYINFLQRGYENSLDDIFKAGMNGMAKLMASIGSKHGEQAFLWAKEGRPVELLKNGVFQAYLATNPLRQYLVQSHQAIRLVGYLNPVRLSKVLVEAGEYLRYTKGLGNLANASQETKDMIKFVQESGMLDAIDKHSLTAGSLTDTIQAMTRSSNLASRVVGKGLEIPRKIGFDAGESTNLIMHILAVREKYLQAGKNLADKYVRDEVYSVARALSYDMNRAGDMPYNSNALGLFLQFMQVPHKAIAAVTFNRRIPVGDKLRMAGMDMLLFGIPGGTALYNLLPKEALPQDAKGREQVVFGATSIAYNALLSKLAGEDTKADWSSLSPYGVDGFGRLFEAVLQGGMEEFYTNSPAATFYFNDHSRMRESLGRMFKWTGFINTQEGHKPEDILSVAKGVAELSSGWTNAMKARAIWNMGQLNDKQGVPLAQDLNWVHGMAQLFGIPPMEVKLSYDALKGVNEKTKEHADEVDRWYKSYIRVLAREQQLSTQDPEFQIKVLGAAKLMWKNDSVALQMINKNLSRDVLLMKDRIIMDAIKFSNIPTSDKLDADIKNLEILNKPDYEKANRLINDMREQTKKVYGN